MWDLASVVLGDPSFDAVLGRTAEAVKRSVAGADEMSVTMADGTPFTVATTGSLACQVDESQYVAGYGPCLDAIRLGQTIVVHDQATETRWPAYSPAAVNAGVNSSVSVPLPVNEQFVGGLNVYSRTSHAFDAAAVRTVEDLAAYAGIMLNNAGLYFTASSRAEQMEEAMQSRASIEQAKGILMGSRNCGESEAFDLLVPALPTAGTKAAGCRRGTPRQDHHPRVASPHAMKRPAGPDPAGPRLRPGPDGYRSVTYPGGPHG
jgi:transcriptional regulator with GAF, ATPase, and Fis domain